LYAALVAWAFAADHRAVIARLRAGREALETWSSGIRSWSDTIRLRCVGRRFVQPDAATSLE